MTKSTHAKKTASKPLSSEAQDDLIGMDETVALLKTTRPTLTRWLNSGKIKGLKAGRQWRFEREEIDRFLRGEKPMLNVPTEIDEIINALLKKLEALDQKINLESEDRIEKTTTLILLLARVMHATDIHITLHNKDAEVRLYLRYRIDGELQVIGDFSQRVADCIISKFKGMAACNVNEKHLPQDGRIQLKILNQITDLRIAALPTKLGEELTIRILDPNSGIVEFERAISEDLRDKVRKLIHSPCGTIIVTGPTGSGKTTTLYACLNELTSSATKAVSIEDPIEYNLPWVSQVQVNTDIGFTFASAMRAQLRSAPDIIMMGETRDLETLYLAIEAAITGHKVLTTLHTNEACSALIRMIEMGVQPFLIADSTRCIIGQRLLRNVCQECAEDTQPEGMHLDQATDLMRHLNGDWHGLDKDFKKGKGCKACRFTGFRGRRAVIEILEVTPTIGRALCNNANDDELRNIAISEGMVPMGVRALQWAAAGTADLGEVLHTFA